MIDHIPEEVLGYHPPQCVSMGLRDLSACDDGTLTAVFEDKERVGRIFTATTQFEPGKPIIKEGVKLDKDDAGWERDPDGGTIALRVRKLPIFCWPMIEKLETDLKAKNL